MATSSDSIGMRCDYKRSYFVTSVTTLQRRRDLNIRYIIHMYTDPIISCLQGTINEQSKFEMGDAKTLSSNHGYN